jgi:hypothetical protein
MIQRLLPIALLVVLAGRASAQRVSSTAPERDRISQDEVRRSTDTDAYPLVPSLRSIWCTRREARLAAPFAPPRRDAEGLIDGCAHPALPSARRRGRTGARG